MNRVAITRRGCVHVLILLSTVKLQNTLEKSTQFLGIQLECDRVLVLGFIKAGM